MEGESSKLGLELVELGDGGSGGGGGDVGQGGVLYVQDGLMQVAFILICIYVWRSVDLAVSGFLTLLSRVRLVSSM